MRLGRTIITSLLTLALSLSVPLCLTAACAKTGSSSSSGSTQTDIELTGIDSFDSIFTQAHDVDERLDSARQAMKDGRSNLNSALGLSSGTPFSDALTDLRDRAQGKLQLVTSGGGLSLTTSDAVPSNVQAAIDSLNSTLSNYQTAISDLAGIKDDATSLASAGKDFPSKLQSDFKNLDLSWNEVPTKLETVRNNVRIMGKMPTRIDKLTTSMRSNITAVTDVISGKGTGSSTSSTSSSSNSSSNSSSSSSDGGRTLNRD